MEEAGNRSKQHLWQLRQLRVPQRVKNLRCFVANRDGPEEGGTAGEGKREREPEQSSASL